VANLIWPDQLLL